jgi:glutamate formiminotransferase / formiminotetrahydrofolate cyclodeaminase
MLVECVPNFSCGEDVAQDLAKIVQESPGVVLLGVESDGDHNRSVLTYAGEPSATLAVAKKLLIKATLSIDLGAHTGVHPRFGATDVFPFVPLVGSDMALCIKLSKDLGQWAGTELGLPVYLYEQAATRDKFENLAALRKHLASAGKERLSPDFGPNEPPEKTGFLITGARFFLLAFNVNLASLDLKLAKKIARRIRESSGGLPGVKALGLRLESRAQVQVSVNLVDYRKTSLFELYQAIENECKAAAVEIAQSELIGFLPETVAFGLGEKAINCAQPLEERILEKKIRKGLPPGDFRELITAISSTEPAPGGGTAASLAGALGASTLLKALRLSEEGKTELKNLGGRPINEVDEALLESEHRYMCLAEEDKEAFGAVMAAYRMSAKEHDKETRRAALRAAKRRAYESSEGIVAQSEANVALAMELLEVGNPNLINDVAVSIEMAVAAARGALWNGLANLGKKDGALKMEFVARLDALELLRGQALQKLREHYKLTAV